MNSIENAVITAAYNALQSKYPGIPVYSDATTETPVFPCVSIYEIDNAAARDTLDTSRIEKYSDVAYQIDVYSNAESGRKAQCKDIIEIIDDTLTGCGLTRTSIVRTPNLGDNNIYRLTARYSARVGKDNTVYRR